jgi:hypothetical protein
VYVVGLKRLILNVAFAVTAASLHAQDGPSGLTRGQIKAGTYSNTFFGIDLRLPEGWLAGFSRPWVSTSGAA